MTDTNDATADALLAFWASVAKSYPEIETGDLQPLQDHEFSDHAREIIKEWVELNTRKPRRFATIEVEQEQGSVPTCATCTKYVPGPGGHGRCGVDEMQGVTGGVCYPTDGCSFHEYNSPVKGPRWDVRYLDSSIPHALEQYLTVSARDPEHAIALFRDKHPEEFLRIVSVIGSST